MFHLKKGTLLLTLALVPTLTGIAGYADLGVVTNFETQLLVRADGKSFYFTSKKPTLTEALKEEGIKVSKFDAADPELGSKLSGGRLNVELKRAKKVQVFETPFGKETKQYLVESGYTEPAKILAQNEIKVASKDIVTSELNFDFDQNEFLGQVIKIKRAARVRLLSDGGAKEIETWEKDVSHFLAERGIILGTDDRVDPSPETKISNGLEVKVIRVFKDEAKEATVIPRPVVYQTDPNLLEGTTQVISVGADGKKEQTFGITYENGAEVSRTLLNEVIIVPAQAKVVVQGTKPQNPNGYWDTIVKAAGMYGVDASKMYRMMMCESGGNASSIGAGFYGLFQYVPSTWANASAGAGWGGASIFDPEAQIYVAAWKIYVSGWGAWPVCGRL